MNTLIVGTLAVIVFALHVIRRRHARRAREEQYMSPSGLQSLRADVRFW